MIVKAFAQCTLRSLIGLSSDFGNLFEAWVLVFELGLCYIVAFSSRYSSCLPLWFFFFCHNCILIRSVISSFTPIILMRLKLSNIIPCNTVHLLTPIIQNETYVRIFTFLKFPWYHNSEVRMRLVFQLSSLLRVTFLWESGHLFWYLLNWLQFVNSVATEIDFCCKVRLTRKREKNIRPTCDCC